MKKIIISLGLFSALFISACNSTNSEEKSSKDSSTKTENSIKEEPIAPAKKETDTTKAIENEPVLASKKIGDYTVDALSAKVNGVVLSVELVIKNPQKVYIDLKAPLKQIFSIDDATGKKASLLKDDAGQYLASPLNDQADIIRVFGYNTGYAINLKFPAPTPESKTVSVTIPNLGGFDGLTITR